MSDVPAITATQIESARTATGGWTRATLASWGVPWPPPRGWKAALMDGAYMPLSVPLPSLTGMDSRGRMRAIRLDDRELAAQLVNVLNELQSLNERARAALLDGNLAALLEVGGCVRDRGGSLMMLAETA